MHEYNSEHKKKEGIFHINRREIPKSDYFYCRFNDSCMRYL